MKKFIPRKPVRFRRPDGDLHVSDYDHVITIRLCETLHEQLLQTAYEMKCSLNQLVTATLLAMQEQYAQERADTVTGQEKVRVLNVHQMIDTYIPLAQEQRYLDAERQHKAASVQADTPQV